MILQGQEKKRAGVPSCYRPARRCCVVCGALWPSWHCYWVPRGAKVRRERSCPAAECPSRKAVQLLSSRPRLHPAQAIISPLADCNRKGEPAIWICVPHTDDLCPCGCGSTAVRIRSPCRPGLISPHSRGLPKITNKTNFTNGIGGVVMGATLPGATPRLGIPPPTTYPAVAEGPPRMHVSQHFRAGHSAPVLLQLIASLVLW